MHVEFDVVDAVLAKNNTGVNTYITAVLAMFSIPLRGISRLLFVSIEHC